MQIMLNVDKSLKSWTASALLRKGKWCKVNGCAECCASSAVITCEEEANVVVAVVWQGEATELVGREGFATVQSSLDDCIGVSIV